MSPLSALASLDIRISEGFVAFLLHPMGRRAGSALGLLSIRTMSLVAVRRSLSSTA